MAPRTGILDEGHPGWRIDATSSRRRLPPSPTWSSGLLLLFIGVGLGRFIFPSHKKTILPDFSSWAKAAPALNSAVTLRALQGSDHLPESIARNFGLTHDECDVGFPLLWNEVNTTRALFEARGGIQLSDVERVDKEDGSRVAIIDGRLYVKRWNPETTTRSQAMLQSLYQAVVSSPEPIPNVEFWFRCTDNLVYGAHFGLNKEEGKALWLLPDFGFWSWPEPRVNGWVEFRRKVMELDEQLSWDQKKDKLFWRGAFLSEFRRKLKELVKKYSWADIGEIDWGAGAAGRVEMEDHCRHKYLASIEGNSGYSGRLKHLLMCRSVTVSHRMKWIQHFHAALNPDGSSANQNIVEMKIKNSWSELPSIMEDLISDPVKSQRIANNAVRTMRGRYLTPASVTCYWRRVLAEYAALQQFTPTMGDGTDFESFILKGRVHWDPS